LAARAAVRICCAHARAFALPKGRGGEAMRSGESGICMANGILQKLKANGKIFHAITNLQNEGVTVGRRFDA
jgi:hypothetical protein